MNTRSILAVSLALAAVTMAALPARANLVDNGSFADGLSGWSTNTSIQYPWQYEPNNASTSFYGIAPGGTYASTGCTGATCITGTTVQQGYLSQLLSTVPGDTYNLTFSFDTEANPGPLELQVLFGGTVADDLTSTVNDLTQYTVDGLLATSSSTDLEFLGRQDLGFDQLTGIDVELAGTGGSPSGPPGVTPEPDTMVLAGTGVLALLGMTRRRLAV